MSKFDSLLTALETKTTAGKVRWGQTDNPNAFETHFGNGISVWLSQYTWFDEDDQAIQRYKAILFDKAGDVINQIEDKDASISLRSLFESARRGAMNADEIIGDLLEELERA